MFDAAFYTLTNKTNDDLDSRTLKSLIRSNLRPYNKGTESFRQELDSALEASPSPSDVRVAMEVLSSHDIHITHREISAIPDEKIVEVFRSGISTYLTSNRFSFHRLSFDNQKSWLSAVFYTLRTEGLQNNVAANEAADLNRLIETKYHKLAGAEAHLANLQEALERTGEDYTTKSSDVRTAWSKLHSVGILPKEMPELSIRREFVTSLRDRLSAIEFTAGQRRWVLAALNSLLSIKTLVQRHIGNEFLRIELSNSMNIEGRADGESKSPREQLAVLPISGLSSSDIRAAWELLHSPVILNLPYGEGDIDQIPDADVSMRFIAELDTLGQRGLTKTQEQWIDATLNMLRSRFNPSIDAFNKKLFAEYEGLEEAAIDTDVLLNQFNEMVAREPSTGDVRTAWEHLHAGAIFNVPNRFQLNGSDTSIDEIPEEMVLVAFASAMRSHLANPALTDMQKRWTKAIIRPLKERAPNRTRELEGVDFLNRLFDNAYREAEEVGREAVTERFEEMLSKTLLEMMFRLHGKSYTLLIS